MNEKTETKNSPQGEAQRGTHPLQRDAKSSEVKRLREEIQKADAAEAQLYAARGHGGYINSETLKEIRTARGVAVSALLELGEKL